MIFLAGKRVYVGKADSSLTTRLAQHAKKLSGRVGPFSGNVAFICLYVEEDLEASAPEKLLMKWYRKQQREREAAEKREAKAKGKPLDDGKPKEPALPWNKNGFGNKDPGKERDTTEIKANHFDALYPINLDLPISLTPRKTDVSTFLNELKVKLPYNLRFQNPHADLGTLVTVLKGSKTVREWIQFVVEALPAGWLATALPGYVILYREDNPGRYRSATSYWLKDDSGSAPERPGQGQKAPPGDIEDDEEDESDSEDGETAGEDA